MKKDAHPLIVASSVIILAFSLPLTLLTANLFILLSPRYVSWQYERLTIGSSEAGHSSAAALAVVDYLKHGTNTLPAMTANESMHLTDVRAAFDLGAGLFRTSLTATLLALGTLALTSRHQALSRLLPAAVGGIVVMSSLLIITLFNFNWIFDRFHGLLFTDGSWTFPSGSVLLRLFPQRFWFSAGAHWILATLAELLALAVVGALARRPRPF